jgi:hypothetical protein
VLPQPSFSPTSLLSLLAAGLIALVATITTPSSAMADDPRPSTSEKKLAEAEARSHNRTLVSSADFYLDSLTQVPYNGSYSDVYLSKWMGHVLRSIWMRAYDHL